MPGKLQCILQGAGGPPGRSACAAPPSSRNIAQETPRPNPQSQSFSRSYGSILPTSLTYIVLSTRGCTPWRPDAVMSTTWGANNTLPRIFKGRRERIGHRKNCSAFPAAHPYRRLSRFQGPGSCQQEKTTLAEAPAGVFEFACVATQYPRPGSGMLTRFPFGRRRPESRTYTGVSLPLRID